MPEISSLQYGIQHASVQNLPFFEGYHRLAIYMLGVISCHAMFSVGTHVSQVAAMRLHRHLITAAISLPVAWISIQRQSISGFSSSSTSTASSPKAHAKERLIDLRQPAGWYPLARQMRRKIIAHLGPTNSGINQSHGDMINPTVSTF